MRLAVYHNLMNGGAMRATREQFQRLGRKHTIDCYSLTCSLDEGRALEEWCSQTRVYDYHLRAMGYPRGFGPLGWLSDFGRLATVQKQIAEDIDTESYDLCLALTCPYFEIPPILRHLQTPAAYYSHSTHYPKIPWPQETKPRKSLNPTAAYLHRVLKREEKRAISCADMVIANSCFMRERLFDYYAVSAYVSYVGVDTNDFHPMPEVERTQAVLGVGTLSRFKAHDFSIRSLATIPSAIRPELWIAHHAEEPGEKVRLQRLAEECCVTLRLIENVNTAELCRLYNSVRATVYPSYFEGLGLVPLESMACGTPVVGVAEGGIRETVMDGVTGTLTNRDEEEFGQAVALLIEKPGEMSAQAREHVLAHWGWDVLVDELDRLLEKAARLKDVQRKS